MNPRVSPHFPWVLAALFALAHVVFALTATIEKCVAFDEVAHLLGGQTYWHHHDFRIHPENGNLPQRLAALPTLFTSWRLPALDDPSWRTSDVWRLANTTLYELGNDTDFNVLLARTAVSLHAFGIVLLVFGWSRRLFGLAGAFTSLALCIFCPTLLAHGPLVTSDVAMAFWMLAATGAYWRFLHKPTLMNGALSAFCLGFAAVAKFSAPLLAPIWVLLWLARCLHPAELVWRNTTLARGLRRSAFLFAATCFQVVGAIAIVWAFYDWRIRPLGESLPPGDYFRNWDYVMRDLGTKGQIFTCLRSFPLLPDAYTYGLANVVAYSQARGAFLNGEVSTTGWLTFFPYAFLVKTPLPLLGALALAFVSGLHAVRMQTCQVLARLWPILPLLVLLAIYWGVSLASHLNIGHRHLLPTYPPLFILAGAAGRWLWQRHRLGRIALALLLAASAATATTIRPHYLAYFNLFAGGPAQGYQHLVESSLDWGQDLPGVAQWLRANARSAEPVQLAYFGTGHPAYEGIVARALPSLPLQELPRPTVLHPGLFVISATMLQQPYGQHNGPWTAARERTYQQMRRLEALAQQWETPTSFRATRERERAFFSDSESVRIWAAYESLRFARLCHYLRARRPDAHVGYSILIYRLSPAELNAALHGSLSDLANLIEQAARE